MGSLAEEERGRGDYELAQRKPQISENPHSLGVSRAPGLKDPQVDYQPVSSPLHLSASDPGPIPVRAEEVCPLSLFIYRD